MKPLSQSTHVPAAAGRRAAPLIQRLGMPALLLGCALAALVPSMALAQAGAVTVPRTAAESGIVDEDTDTPYVPTPADVVERMLQLAGVGKTDYLIDIGSGDGRIVLTAVSKFGARGHGIEIDSRLVERSRQSAKRMGIADRARFLTQDLFESDFSKATVISVYLLPKVMQLLTPKLAALRPGTRIVSHDYAMLADWQPDMTLRMYVPDKPVGRDRTSTLMLWTVPAQVAGRWSFDLPQAHGGGRVEIAVSQAHQMLTGKATRDGQPLDVAGLRIDGDRLRFALEPSGRAERFRHEFDGVVKGDAVSGTARFNVRTDAPVIATKWEARLAR
jgi:hypothetical protein